MSTEEAQVTRLTDHPAKDFWPAWSPDGTKIAFVFLPSKGPPQIHVMNADGTGVKPLTEIPGGTDTPAWSPLPGAAG